MEKNILKKDENSSINNITENADSSGVNSPNNTTVPNGNTNPSANANSFNQAAANNVASSGNQTANNNVAGANNQAANNDSSTINTNSLDIFALNEISKTARMGMGTISFLANRISNMKMKKELVAIYSQYSNIMSQINQHFEKYGEIPVHSNIIIKMMSRCGIRMNTMRDRSNSHIAELMIQGSQMGIVACQKLLNQNLNIESSTTDMIKTLIDFQNKNIQKLNAYL